ncbi:MAG: DUF3576 domain-containing protein [Acidimicrobiia bacterium]
MPKYTSWMVGFLGAAAVMAGAACSGDNQYEYPTKVPGTGGTYSSSAKKQDSILGADDFNICGSSKKNEPGAGGIGVNSFLWRASLDSISFMPVASADAFGGVIITDWYALPETPNERFKVNIYILGRQLRADGVKAAVFRQRRDPGGNWVDATVEAKTTIDLENVILTRARQLRLDSERP